MVYSVSLIRQDLVGKHGTCIVRQAETHAALIQHPKVRGIRASRTVRLVGWGERRAGQGGQKRCSCLDLDFPTHRKHELCLAGTLISHAFQVPRSRQRRKSLSYAASLPRAALMTRQLALSRTGQMIFGSRTGWVIEGVMKTRLRFITAGDVDNRQASLGVQ